MGKKKSSAPQAKRPKLKARLLRGGETGRRSARVPVRALPSLDSQAQRHRRHKHATPPPGTATPPAAKTWRNAQRWRHGDRQQFNKRNRDV